MFITCGCAVHYTFYYRWLEEYLKETKYHISTYPKSYYRNRIYLPKKDDTRHQIPDDTTKLDEMLKNENIKGFPSPTVLRSEGPLFKDLGAVYEVKNNDAERRVKGKCDLFIGRGDMIYGITAWHALQPSGRCLIPSNHGVDYHCTALYPADANFGEVYEWSGLRPKDLTLLESEDGKNLHEIARHSINNSSSLVQVSAVRQLKEVKIHSDFKIHKDGSWLSIEPTTQETTPDHQLADDGPLMVFTVANDTPQGRLVWLPTNFEFLL